MKSLEQLTKNARDIASQGQYEVRLGDLMHQDFMEAHTKFPTLQAFFDASGFKVDSPEDLTAIPDEEWDAHVRSSSTFESWIDMQKTAVAQYTRDRLFKNL